MNTISKAHQIFSECLNDPKVLSQPQDFLGPNYKAVLNFWMILDGLSEEQWKTIRGRFNDFYDKPCSKWIKASITADKASIETIGVEFAVSAADAAFGVYETDADFHATKELIGMHLLLDQQKPLTFFQMFLDL